MAARMPIITTTISSSIKVKPLRFMLHLHEWAMRPCNVSPDSLHRVCRTRTTAYPGSHVRVVGCCGGILTAADRASCERYGEPQEQYVETRYFRSVTS